MLSSVDGKVSSGPSDSDDLELVLKANGLKQYFALEKQTDEWCFNSGRVLAKVIDYIGIPKEQIPVNLVVADTRHLTPRHVERLCMRFKNVFIATEKNHHPAFNSYDENLSIIHYKRGHFTQLFDSLYNMYGCERLTIQSGGTINSILFSLNLIDRVKVVAAPIIVGGHSTPTMVDGLPVETHLTLNSVSVLKHSYVVYDYSVKEGK